MYFFQKSGDLWWPPWEKIDKIFKYVFRYVSDSCNSAVAVSNILNTLPENDMDFEESMKEPLSFVYAVDKVMDGGKLGISLEEYEESV